MNPLNLDEITAACNAARERDFGGRLGGNVGKAVDAAYNLGWFSAYMDAKERLGASQYSLIDVIGASTIGGALGYALALLLQQ